MATALSVDAYYAILREDLMTFIHACFVELNPETEFSARPHIEMIASKLEAVRRGKIKRLIINLPPRSLKSHSVSVAFVAWLLGHDPAARIICASYGQELADKHARDCRSLMLSAFYRSLFPRTVLSREKMAVGEFVTTQQGFRLSTSVGGVLTGRGADYLILDDPLKPEEALSESRRNSVNDWFDTTLLSRLDNKNTGRIILIMQRLHQDDLVGHVLEQGGWEVLSFPAIAEKDETHLIASPLGSKLYQRKEGEVLDSSRESLAVLEQMRVTAGEYNFQSQYQQNPMPQGGMMIKREWLLYYTREERPTEFRRIYQSWDTANKSGELNDYSVCTTWGEYDKRFYLLDVFRDRLNYPELKKAVRRQYDMHRPNIISIEDKASGTQLIQELRGEGLYKVKAYEAPAGTDKIMRLHSQTALFADGRVLLPKHAPWLAEYVRELTTFPGSKFDDQVDSTTQALEFLGKWRPSLYDYL